MTENRTENLKELLLNIHPFEVVYKCYMERYFKQHPIYSTVTKEIDKKLTSLAFDYKDSCNESLNTSFACINPYLGKVQLDEENNKLNQSETKTKELEDQFIDLLKANINSKLLDDNISIFFEESLTPIKLIELFLPVDITGLLQFFSTESIFQFCSNIENLKKVSDISHKEYSYQIISTDFSNYNVSINVNHKNLIYYLQKQIHFCIVNEEKGILDKENKLFFVNSLANQVNELYEFIHLSDMISICANNLNINIKEEIAQFKDYFQQKSSNQNIDYFLSLIKITDYLYNPRVRLSSLILDDNCVISIDNNRTDFFYSIFDSFYHRLLGLKMYEFLKDKNVKTIPNAIAKKQNWLTQCKPYKDEKNELNKLTNYYKTTKKCIEYGLLLPFSSKY